MRLRISTGALALLLLSATTRTTTAGEVHNAVTGNNLARLKALIEKDPSLVDAPQRGNGYTPLLFAVSYGRLPMVEYLLSKGADVNKMNRYGQSPTLFAAMNGNEKMIDAILAKKPKMNVADRSGNTPLLYAVQYGRKNIVQKLLKAGASAKTTTNYGYNALHMACMHGYYYRKPGERAEVVKMLIKAGADPKAKSRDTYRPTLLHLAAANGLADVATVLIAQKLDVNAKNVNDDTPLHFAARLGDQYNYSYGNIPQEAQQRYGTLVETLLKAGADANALNKQKQTPLQLAVTRNSYVAVNHLLPKTKNVGSIKPVTGESMFHWCCKHGLDKALAILLKKEKIDISKKDASGQTALVIACEGKTAGHAGVVKLLLDKGANVNQKLDTGETVLHVAAWNGNAKMVRTLLAAKASYGVKDKSGYTPLHLAAWNGHADVVAALLNAGAKADAAVNGGSTPLHSAAWKGHEAVVKILLAKGANVNAKDTDGLTPLHKAAWNGHLNVVRALVEAGATVNAKDNDGYTPTVKAREQKKTAVVVYLKSKGGIDSAKQQ